MKKKGSRQGLSMPVLYCLSKCECNKIWGKQPWNSHYGPIEGRRKVFKERTLNGLYDCIRITNGYPSTKPSQTKVLPWPGLPSSFAYNNEITILMNTFRPLVCSLLISNFFVKKRFSSRLKRLTANTERLIQFAPMSLFRLKRRLIKWFEVCHVSWVHWLDFYWRHNSRIVWATNDDDDELISRMRFRLSHTSVNVSLAWLPQC